MRTYTLFLDRGPKPWFSGRSREFHFVAVASVDASRRSVAVKRVRERFGDEMRDAAAWKLEIDPK